MAQWNYTGNVLTSRTQKHVRTRLEWINRQSLFWCYDNNKIHAMRSIRAIHTHWHSHTVLWWWHTVIPYSHTVACVRSLIACIDVCVTSSKECRQFVVSLILLHSLSFHSMPIEISSVYSWLILNVFCFHLFSLFSTSSIKCFYSYLTHTHRHVSFMYWLVDRQICCCAPTLTWSWVHIRSYAFEQWNHFLGWKFEAIQKKLKNWKLKKVSAEIANLTGWRNWKSMIPGLFWSCTNRKIDSNILALQLYWVRLFDYSEVNTVLITDCESQFKESR